MTRAPAGSDARASQLRRTTEVVVATMLPRRLSAEAARALVRPVAVALAALVAAAVLCLVVAVELAVAAWGSAVVTAVVLLAALVVPAARLSLSGPPAVALALVRAAPLLRALDLGDGLARRWAAAAAVPVIVPTAALGAATALVLGVRAEHGGSLAIVAAAAAGALPAVAIAHRGGRRVAAGSRAVGPLAMAARRLVVLGALGGVLIATGPPALLEPPTAVAAAGLGAAVWVAGDALALDARPWLRLQAALVDCGASASAVVGRAAVGAAIASGAVGAAIGLAGGAIGGADAGLSIGIAGSAVAIASLAVLVLEPDPTAAAARCLVFALATAPIAWVLLAHVPALWSAGWAVLAATAAALVLVRRLS